MLNKIWFWLLLIGILYGFAKGSYHSLTHDATEHPVVAAEHPVVAAEHPVVAAEHPVVATEEEVTGQPASDGLGPRTLQQVGKDLNEAALDAATLSVTICIGLIGIMALWLGMLNIARDAGLVDALARLLSPLMRWLFPDVPDGHPAQGAMLMNMSANMLGLDNAATPLGLKAMQDLQTLNPQKDTATDAMAMFLAINTSNVTVVPFTLIGYRVLAGSENPAQPIAAILLTTSVTTVVAVIAARLLSRSSRHAVCANGLTQSQSEEKGEGEEGKT